MQQKLWHSARCGMQRAKEWLGHRIEQSKKCHECDRPVGLLADYCPHCGAARTVKSTISPSLLVTAFCSEALLILMHFS
jgi:hypothetical protein